MAWWPDSGQQWRRGAAQLALLALLGLVLAGCITRGPRAGASLQDCAQCPALVVVPAGEFRMGAAGGEEGRPEGPVHTVHIARAFALGRHEVTQAQFAAFVSATGHAMGGGCQVWAGEWRTPPDADWTDPGYGRMPFDDEPVTCVSWNDAEAYVQWLARRTGRHYRLPSEAEWEYAARAGSTGDYFWAVPGTDADAAACTFANVYDASGARANGFGWAPFGCDDGFARAAPVGSFRPNAFGLHDMIGNVWEWTTTPYAPQHRPGAPKGCCTPSLDPDPAVMQTLKGGSHLCAPEYCHRYRPAARSPQSQDSATTHIGFRCVVTR